jgi:CheY-like chemotaxis protein
MANILVIEDDDSVRATVVRFLERFGHAVSQAANGRDGLHLFRQNPADVVVTDIFMPHTDGLEVILEVKKISTSLAVSIPVIAVSGGTVLRDEKSICFLKQAKLFGADRVFPKPLDFMGLQQAILELMPV